LLNTVLAPQRTEQRRIMRAEMYTEDAVLRHHQISLIPRPKPQDLHALQQWLSRPSLGGVYLTGRDRDVWSDGQDLAAIGCPASQTRATAWVAESVLPVIYRAWISVMVSVAHSIQRQYLTSTLKPKTPTPSGSMRSVVQYSSQSISKAVSLGGVMIASLLPILAIVVLYQVQGTGIRLGLISIFSAFFSASIWAFGDGRLSDVFSATAA
jgi:hypothetical protein